MRLDRPLGVGARGGHGPVRHTVVGWASGRRVRFRFTGPRGFHEYVTEEADGGVVLNHLLAMRVRPRPLMRVGHGPAGLTRPLFRRRSARFRERGRPWPGGGRTHVAVGPYVRLLRCAKGLR
ncbi:hypothetical protein ABT010_10670 [Streptomyces sp. NPDC002668]|uniref:hypothetical protein n=1 Tax=Streptomyces sp. NPDC002668 TaxID=3154422 RepID=UPI003320D6F7